MDSISGKKGGMRRGSGRAASGPAKPYVFVVDGDEEVRRSLRLLLRNLDLEVEDFATAEEALPRILESPPSCLISEVYLRGMSGTELQREIRSRGLHLPVIILATHADVPLAVEAMRLGAADFIEKPIIDRLVLAQVRALTSRPRRGDAEGTKHTRGIAGS